MPNPDRGFMINEVMSAMAFENHLRKLAEKRERKKRKKKEADKAATLTTSRGLSGDKTYIYYSGKGGVCQVYDTSSTASGPPSPQGEGLRGAVCRE